MASEQNDDSNGIAENPPLKGKKSGDASELEKEAPSDGDDALYHEYDFIPYYNWLKRIREIAKQSNK